MTAPLLSRMPVSRAGMIGTEPIDTVEGAVLQGAALLAFALLGDAHGVALGQRQRHGVIDVKAPGLIEGQRQQARRAVLSQAGEHDAPVPGLDDLEACAVRDALGVLDELHDHSGPI